MKTREAAAIAAALLIARLARLRFERDPDATPPPFGNCLKVSSAHLLLVPSTEVVGSDNALIEGAVGRLGHDALVVRAVGRSHADISFDVVLADEPAAWSTPLKLWLHADATPHLVLAEADTTCFALLPTGLRGRKSLPWTDHNDREAGLQRGRQALADVLEGR